MPKFIDHTGEKRMMNCGLEATIIRYGSYKDIDVQFEDGQVVFHRDYSSFQKGAISPPIDPRYSHLGEKRMMKCGLEATIIRYGSSRDIDVQFEDGQVVYHRKYNCFKKGTIAPPNYTRLIDRTGEKRMMNCGLEATIIRYGSYMDIDVQFEDGQVVYHRDYSSFKRGTITLPVERVGEKRMMNCGLEATIIRYGSSQDIDVRFEDGQVVYHSYYSSFKIGAISPPIDPRKIVHIGEKRMMNCGLEATIIRYGSCMDIDVQFEDGQVVYHRNYNNFIKGMITPPIDPRKIVHIGEKRMMKCGSEATIIRYGSSRDIDVQFEDGQVVYHRDYSAFQKGEIAPPNYTRLIDRTGEKHMMKCGLEATIIRYGSSRDIDVQFEDGQVVYHRNYNCFKKGTIAPPIHPRKIDRTGEKRMMNCGLEATIIRYGSSQDIDVQFEDGQVVFHRDYSSFKKGAITHPGFKANKSKPSLYKSFITHYTGRHPETGEPYYHCKCQNCGFEIIDTARNIIKLEHKCEITAT